MNDLNFTYILGAGASAQKALPTVENIQDRLLNYHKYSFETSKGYQTPDPARVEIINEFEWLGNEITNHLSPDTRAKVAFLSGDYQTYNRIKNALSIFFYMEEICAEINVPKVDARYINFIASVLKAKAVWPENIRILSWNYDFQFELAANRIVKDKSKAVGQVRIPPLVEYFPPAGPDKMKAYKLVHLNGCAYVKTGDNPESYFHEEPRMSLSIIWNELKNQKENQFIRFAWEGMQPEMNFADYLPKTDYLVIIGYSFPFFNRETDSRIFDLIKAGKRLRKIYFQNPNLKGEFIYNQFNITRPIKSIIKGTPIEHIDKTDYLFIPSEF